MTTIPMQTPDPKFNLETFFGRVRSAAARVLLLGLKRAPETWGSHGWERLQPHGEYNVGRITPSALEVLVTADEWIAEIEALGGRCECKPAALAFHWRGLDNARIARIRHT